MLPESGEQPGRPRERYWLHAILFLLTFLTTTTVGARLAYNFDRNRPIFLEDDVLGVLTSFGQTISHPMQLLSGLLSICAECKRIKDEHDHWQPLESYIQAYSEAKFTHGMCQDCLRKLYPEYYPK